MSSESHLPPPDVLLEHAAWVTRLARRLIRDEEDAADAVQDTWLAFLRLRPDQHRPLRPWLARVIQNQAALRLRKRSARQARESEVAGPGFTLDAEELLARGEIQRELVTAVLGLPEPYRSTLLLRYYEGLQPKKIAELQGLAPATVRTHLARGHARLRETLDESHGGNRQRWQALFAPLLPPPTQGAPGALSAPLAKAVAIAACVAALVGGYKIWASAPGALEAPPVEDSQVARVATGGIQASPEHERVALGVSGPGAQAVPPMRELQLVNAATGAPLAEYTIRFGEELRTADHRGRVRVPSAVSVILGIDHPKVVVWEVARHGTRDEQTPAPPALALGPNIRVPIPVGPAIRFRLQGSAAFDASTFVVRLGPIPSKPGRDHGKPIYDAPLHPGPSRGYWARFHPESAPLWERDAPRRLEVRDSMGFLYGWCDITGEEARSAAAVTVTLAPTARLRGMARGAPAPNAVEASTPSFAGAEITLVAKETPWSTFVPLDETGAFSLSWIPPGDYVVRVVSPLVEDWESEITLGPGESRWLDAPLQARASGGTVSGTVTAAGAEFREQLLIFARTQAGEVLGVFPTTWTEQGDGRVSPFHFEDLPTGPLRLDVISLDSAALFDVQPTHIEAPIRTVAITQRDRGPCHDLEVSVVSGASEAQVSDYQLTVHIDGSPGRTFIHKHGPGGSPTWTLVAGAMRWNEFTGPAPLRSLPDHADLTWRLEAEGHAPASGTARDATTLADGTRVLTIRLQPVQQSK